MVFNSVQQNPLHEPCFVSVGGFAHDQLVTCLDINNDSTILASGSEDGVLKLTHLGNGKVRQ